MRIQQESLTFRDSAIRDLAISIQLLEKARSEYRAALLWMKDVSVKLQNPDYRDQLAKFREVCVYVHVHTCMHAEAYCSVHKLLLCVYSSLEVDYSLTLPPPPPPTPTVPSYCERNKAKV